MNRYCIFLLFPAFLFLTVQGELGAKEVRVQNVQFNVRDGNTRESALRRWVQVSENQVYSSMEELQTVVDRDVQELVNLEVFLSVKAGIIPSENDSQLVTVVFNITDATTFVPIPLPLYNSNYGGLQLLYVQIWDNMFGSLVDWFSIVTLVIREDSDGKLETGPFFIAPRISNIKVNNFVFGVGLDQENVESKRLDGTREVSNYRYDRTSLYLSSEFRFGELRRLYYTIKPGLELRYGYKDLSNIGGFEQTPFQTNFQHSLYYDSTDIFFNSRKGFRTGIKNITRLKQDENGVWTPSTDIFFEAKPYLAFGKEGRLSYYPRFIFMHVFNGTFEKLGAYMRGVTDVTMDGTTAFFLNQSIGIAVWKWNGVWDLQIHPYFDLGFTLGGTRDFEGWKDIRRSLGADILLFIEKVPNLAFRFTWGIDLDEKIPASDRSKTEFIVRYSFSY